jgi:hypothetical protein
MWHSNVLVENIATISLLKDEIKWSATRAPDFLDRGLLLEMKLLNQEFLFVKLKSSLGKLEYLCHKWPQKLFKSEYIATKNVYDQRLGDIEYFWSDYSQTCIKNVLKRQIIVTFKCFGRKYCHHFSIKRRNQVVTLLKQSLVLKSRLFPVLS